MNIKNNSIVLIAGLVAMSITTIVVNVMNAPKFGLPTVSYVAEDTKESYDICSAQNKEDVFTAEELEEFKNSANDTLKDYDYKIEDYKNEKTAKTINVEPEFPIDINTATQKDLEAIPNIGPKTAQSILVYRDLCGGHIASIEDLSCIKGIGDKTVVILKEHLYV